MSKYVPKYLPGYAIASLSTGWRRDTLIGKSMQGVLARSTPALCSGIAGEWLLVDREPFVTSPARDGSEWPRKRWLLIPAMSSLHRAANNPITNRLQSCTRLAAEIVRRQCAVTLKRRLQPMFPLRNQTSRTEFHVADHAPTLVRLPRSSFSGRHRPHRRVRLHEVWSCRSAKRETSAGSSARSNNFKRAIFPTKPSPMLNGKGFAAGSVS